MVTRDDVFRVLHTINDPEMPISIVDLGIVEKVELRQDDSSDRTQVIIELLPTFVGCPALPVIEGEIRHHLMALPGVAQVEIRLCYAPAWSVDRITAAGRESLRHIGVTVPRTGDDRDPACPFCGSTSVRLESSFGPTRCRMIWYCETCRNPFEHLKRIGAPPSSTLLELSTERLRAGG